MNAWALPFDNWGRSLVFYISNLILNFPFKVVIKASLYTVYNSASSKQDNSTKKFQIISISNSLQDLIKDVNIIAEIRTDHLAISLHLLEIEESQRGPGFWKMNTSSLTDENLVQKLKERPDQWIKEGDEFFRSKSCLGLD